MHEFAHEGAGQCLGKDVTLTAIGIMLTCQLMKRSRKTMAIFRVSQVFDALLFPNMCKLAGTEQRGATRREPI